jgi:polysaccharide biosynthesis/export protein
MKMKKNVKFVIQITFLFLIMVSIFSCVPIEKLSYLNDIDQLQEPIVNPKEHKLIMPFDKLYIKIYSIDEKTNLLLSSNETMSSTSSTSLIGYYVDESGDIYYPLVGKIKVGGLSTIQASAKITETLNESVSVSSVIVRFIDNNVTLVGEVNRQGSYTFTQDKLNIYEALALGGGISNYGNRKNIVLIRQEGDKIMHHKLDLSDSRIAAKDYYYIQANDVIVVEPMRNLSTSYNNNTYSLILSSISAISTILSIFLVIKVL